MKLARYVASVLSLSLLAACADAPTAAVQADGVTPSFNQYVTVSGPASISASGSYTFSAGSNLIQPSFTWYSRYCPDTDVASCTAPWGFSAYSPWSGQYHAQITRSLTYDCSGDRRNSYQLKVVASGLWAPDLTEYHVTLLCGRPVLIEA